MGYALSSSPSKYLVLNKKKPGSAVFESRLFSGYSASPPPEKGGEIYP
jgi:hypothetical protein